MKKSLFALAALSAFATAAQAQSSVTLYGNLDATEAWISSAANKSVALTAAANSTSLWGLTGSEDLGGGMKMGFDLKSEINLTLGQTGSSSNTVPITAGNGPTAAGQGVAASETGGGTTNLFNRGSNIFISSVSLGEVKIGRQDDLEWAMGGNYSTSNSNSFGSNQGKAQIGNIQSAGLGYCNASVAANAPIGLCGSAGQAAGNYSYMGSSDAFMTGIAYSTPTFAGFTAKVQTGLGANSPTQGYNVGQQQSAVLSYKGMGGNLDAGLGQTRRFDDQGLLGMTLTSLGLKYKVTPAITLTGYFATTSVSGPSYIPANAGAGTAANPTTVPNSGVHGNDMWSLGVNYQVTPAFDVSLAYTNIQDNSNTTQTSVAYGTFTSASNSVNMYGLTGRYALSKRTQFYGGVGQANNSGMFFMSPIYGGAAQTPIINQAAFAGGAAANLNGMGANIFAAMIGLKHSF